MLLSEEGWQEAGPQEEVKAGSAKLETPISGGELAANIFLFPLALAFAQPHYGFESFPYEEGRGYGNGERDWAGNVSLGGQGLPGGRSGGHAALRVRGANRLGWDAAWDGWATGALRGVAGAAGRRGDLYSGHILCNYVQSGGAFLELGLGAAAFHRSDSRGGPSAALTFELFPREPWTLSASWQGALLRGQGYHVLDARLGATWHGAGLYAGWQAFLGPAGDAGGPQFGVAAFF
ncbi:MAG: hypothetical protein NTX64_15215 [Elusimicrobia bacterium]|nr:hypothetical protein [Elusimicrobiota bacterium]